MERSDDSPWSVTVVRVSHFDTAALGEPPTSRQTFMAKANRCHARLDIACVVQSASPAEQQPLAGTASAVAMLILRTQTGVPGPAPEHC